MAGHNETPALDDRPFRRAVAVAAAANLAYFGFEAFMAGRLGSVSLFADSVDFLEDASVNMLILLALGWSLKARSRLGMALAAVLLFPALGSAAMAWHKLHDPAAPESVALSLTGLGALIVNVSCAWMLARFRSREDSLSKAVFLSARNDALANVAVIASGIAGGALHSGTPDLVVGVGIALMNAGAAWEVLEAAKHDASQPHAHKKKIRA